MVSGCINLKRCLLCKRLITPLFTDYAYKHRTIYIPKKSTDTVVIDGEPDDIANKIINILKDEIRVL